MSEGSPLLVYGQQLTEGVRQHLQELGIPVVLGMRYGNPQLVLRLNCCVKKGAIGFSYYRYFHSTLRAQPVLRWRKPTEKHQGIGIHLIYNCWSPSTMMSDSLRPLRLLVGLIGSSNQIMCFSASMVCQSGTYRKVMTQVNTVSSRPIVVQRFAMQTGCAMAPIVIVLRLLGGETRYSSGEIQYQLPVKIRTYPWLKPYTDQVIEEMLSGESRGY